LIIYANLDQEARWSGLGVPAHVARRISAVSALLAALAPGADVEIWAPAAVDPARLLMEPPPVMRVGVPPRWDLAWADPAAKAVNDRRFALRVAKLAGTRVIESVDDLDGEWPGEWVAKAVWTAAGRDRARGQGAPSGELRARVANLVARAGAVVVEPWLERVADLGVCSFVGRAPNPPHTLLVDERGGFTGIDLSVPELPPAMRDELDATVAACDRALAAAGYSGPFTVDAFVYRGERGPTLRPLCELNARYTFGHVARALGCRALRFGAPPSGARVLVAPTADDPTTAWVA
jgi:hypothetical protein